MNNLMWNHTLVPILASNLPLRLRDSLPPINTLTRPGRPFASVDLNQGLQDEKALRLIGGSHS